MKWLKNLKNKNNKIKKKKTLNIQETKIVASGPVNSWKTDGETMERMIDFILLGSTITVDSDCNHEIKTFAPWKKGYDKPRQCMY